MRIGIDARLYSSRFTGIGRYVKELVDRVTRLDTENEYVLFLNEPEYSEFQCPAPHVKKVKVNAKHYSMSEQTLFVRDLNAMKLDLMHFTHFNAPVLYSRPSIVTIHDLTLHKFPGQQKQSLVHKMGYRVTIKNVVRRAARVITVSEHTKKDLTDLLGTDAEKVHVIYEGISDIFRPVTDNSTVAIALMKYGIQKPYLFYTGAWREHKNLIYLVRAFNICRNRGMQPQLVLGGNTDQNPYKARVDRVVHELGLESFIRTPGHIDEADMPALYSGAVAFVFPSLYEGFGLPPLEAMSCGTPVVCSNVTSIPEICGDSAAYFDPTDIHSMADTIQAVYESETTQAQLVQRGLVRVQQFSWERMAEQILALYRSMTPGVTPASPAVVAPTASPTPEAPTS